MDKSEEDQNKTDQEMKNILKETRTPRTVFPLRGRECNVPLVCPKILIILNCILSLFSGEELKAKAPPAEHFFSSRVLP